MEVLEALFSSRVRVSLLRVLLADPAPELHGRELARRAGERQSAVWRELQHLEAIGMVHRRERDSMTCFAVRSEFPLLAELRLLFARAEGRGGETPAVARPTAPPVSPAPRSPRRPQIVVGEDD